MGKKSVIIPANKDYRLDWGDFARRREVDTCNLTLTATEQVITVSLIKLVLRI